MSRLPITLLIFPQKCAGGDNVSKERVSARTAPLPARRPRRLRDQWWSRTRMAASPTMPCLFRQGLADVHFTSLLLLMVVVLLLLLSSSLLLLFRQVIWFWRFLKASWVTSWLPKQRVALGTKEQRKKAHKIGPCEATRWRPSPLGTRSY